MNTALNRGQLESLLLGILTAGPAHGYEIISALKDRSDGAFDLPEGTVYPVLHRLEREQLLASEWEDSGGRKRRVYRITAAGETNLQQAKEHWRGHVRSVNLILGVQS
ncbi:MAG TPA: PadR family transcriptional regulator [Humibacter sp.]|jgi:DNA-binding PadR family transcriptional regulator|nr:PadR family transcriptional regulator [Humibacter sp.]